MNELGEVTSDELQAVDGGWGVSAFILMQYHIEALGYSSEQAHQYGASLTPMQRE